MNHLRNFINPKPGDERACIDAMADLTENLTEKLELIERAAKIGMMDPELKASTREILRVIASLAKRGH